MIRYRMYDYVYECNTLEHKLFSNVYTLIASK